MGSLDRRIEALEKLYAAGEGSGLHPPDLEERRSALLADVQRARERAESKASEKGDTKRLHALEALERHMKGAHRVAEAREWGLRTG